MSDGDLFWLPVQKFCILPATSAAVDQSRLRELNLVQYVIFVSFYIRQITFM